ncbi:hypothetical protein AB0D10_45725, partial [Kitasatospora sp. NPDC048545]
MEAISKGVSAFREPKAKDAASTMAVTGADRDHDVGRRHRSGGDCEGPLRRQRLPAHRISRGCGTFTQLRVITQLASSIFGGSDAARRLAAPERLPSIVGDARPGVGRRGRDTSGPVHRHRSGRGDARVPAAAEQRRGGRPVVVGADTHARGEGRGSWWAPELDVGAGGRWWLPARSCADRKLPLLKNLPTKGVERQPDWANLCGLPGFAPAKNPEAQLDVSQQVTTGFAPIWSCTIGTNPTHDGRTKVFAITTDPRTTALTRKDG